MNGLELLLKLVKWLRLRIGSLISWPKSLKVEYMPPAILRWYLDKYELSNMLVDTSVPMRHLPAIWRAMSFSFLIGVDKSPNLLK